MKMKCKHCKYEWKHKGKLFYALCPRCRRYTKIEDKVKKDEGSTVL